MLVMPITQSPDVPLLAGRDGLPSRCLMLWAAKDFQVRASYQGGLMQ
jgi:hypothetical protein